MREYETVFVLHPSYDEKELESEIQGVRDLITASGGTVDDVERWGRRRLAYEIQKVHEGIYTLIRFHADPPALRDLDRRFRLNERLLRFLTVLNEGLPPPPPHTETESEGPDSGHEAGDFEAPRRGRGRFDRYSDRPAAADHGVDPENES